MLQPGSLRPLRTVRATFTAYDSDTFKALPANGNPAGINSLGNPTLQPVHPFDNFLPFDGFPVVGLVWERTR